MTTIYLIRHAEAEGNLYRRIHGWYDSLITENGYLQIQALERRFQDIPLDAVYSSDLTRTMTTAQAVYVPKHLPLHTDPGLRELHLGEWEDRPWGEVGHCDPAEMGRFNRCDNTWRAPRGETLQEAGGRLLNTIRRIAQNHPTQTVAIFSHGSAIRQLLTTLKHIAPEHWHDVPHGENTCVTKLLFDSGNFTILYEMDASHLSQEISTLGKQSWWKKDGAKARDVNLWFRPADWPADRASYLQARSDAWHSTHTDGPTFDGDGFLRAAEEHLAQSPWGVSFAMSDDKCIGVLELDAHRYQEMGAGYIPFCYVMPQFWDDSMVIQLIGQAVAFFRPMGRDRLRLCCAPDSHRDQQCYAKYGFTKIGQEPDSRVPLDILEKYIGFPRKPN